MNVLGLIVTDVGKNENGIGHLSPFGGSYRLIDFSLSAFSNSGIKDIIVEAEEKHLETEEYLSGHEICEVAEVKTVFPRKSRKTVTFYSSVEETLPYIASLKKETVVISSGLTVFNCDLSELICKSLKYKNIPARLNANGTLLNVYAVNTNALIKAAEKYGIKRFLSEADVIRSEETGFEIRNESDHRYFNIKTVIERSVYRSLFGSYSLPVYSKSFDSSPAFFGKKASVTNSMIADGCSINGKVKNSVVFPFSTLEEGSCAEDCVIMTGGKLKKGEIIKNATVYPK